MATVILLFGGLLGFIAAVTALFLGAGWGSVALIYLGTACLVLVPVLLRAAISCAMSPQSAQNNAAPMSHDPITAWSDELGFDPDSLATNDGQDAEKLDEGPYKVA